jgi:hypothetical protein
VSIPEWSSGLPRIVKVPCHHVIMIAMTWTAAFEKGPLRQTPEFEQNLDRLAEVAVGAGLGLAPGQELVMTATLDAIPLARRITEHAYKAGASLVTALFTDEVSAAASPSLRSGR